jgi:hypothetical protein
MYADSLAPEFANLWPLDRWTSRGGKSDIETSMAKLAGCRAQLCAYRKQTGAERALLVLMTAGKDLDV